MAEKIEQLKPCPFCGSSSSIERYGDRRQSTIYQCDGCSCSLETGEEWGHGTSWNRRVGPDVDLLEALTRLVRNGQKQGWNETYSEDMDLARAALAKAGA